LNATVGFSNKRLTPSIVSNESLSHRNHPHVDIWERLILSNVYFDILRKNLFEPLHVYVDALLGTGEMILHRQFGSFEAMVNELLGAFDFEEGSDFGRFGFFTPTLQSVG
jgi:hypothetical protein